MKKTTSQHIKLGIFVISGTLILIVALYFIGNRQHLFTKNIQLYAEFTNVNGLQLGNNVRYSGINVGTVSNIEMNDSAKIVVEMMIEEKTGKYIRKDAYAAIGSDGLVGSMVINISPGQHNLPPVRSGDTIISYNKVGTEDMLNTLNVTNENVAQLTSNLLEITNHILNGQGTLGLLISDSTISRDIKISISKLRETTESTSSSLKKINSLIARIDLEKSPAGVLLSDTLAGGQISSIIKNLETSSTNIGEVTSSLEDLIKEIKEGDGALNYLTNDETLVKNIDTTLINIKESSYKLNQNMEALKNNFLFRGYFKKLERKQKRAEKKLKN